VTCAAYRQSVEYNQSTRLQDNRRTIPSLRGTVLGYLIAALDRQRQGDGAREAPGHVKNLVAAQMPQTGAGNDHDWLIAQNPAQEAENLLDGDKTPDTTNKTNDKHDR